VRKEMNNVRNASKILNGEESVPPTYQEIRCHVIFDVKMEDFRRKSRFVAGGHTTDTPPSMIYASVVSRESVRIALTLAALNDLNVKMADIENAYLTAPITEKVWTVLPISGWQGPLDEGWNTSWWYWAYMFIYVDDIMCVHHDPSSPLANLDEYLKMK
jgi:hypothetical protein